MTRRKPVFLLRHKTGALGAAIYAEPAAEIGGRLVEIQWGDSVERLLPHQADQLVEGLKRTAAIARDEARP